MFNTFRAMVNKNVERGNGCKWFPDFLTPRFKPVPYHSFLGGLIGVTCCENVWITELKQKNIYVKERAKGLMIKQKFTWVVETEIHEKKMEKYSHWSSEHKLLLFLYSSFFLSPPSEIVNHCIIYVCCHLYVPYNFNMYYFNNLQHNSLKLLLLYLFYRGGLSSMQRLNDLFMTTQLTSGKPKFKLNPD